MDRAYLDFDRPFSLHQAGAFFVTRAKSNTDFWRIYSAPSGPQARNYLRPNSGAVGLLQSTKVSTPSTAYSVQRYRDRENSGIPEQFVWPSSADTICALYKARWQVELFFRWVKQHLRTKQFYGTSENAVKTQIWTAVSIYVLVAIIKKRFNLDALLYTLLHIFSITLFEKIPLNKDFLDKAHGTDDDTFSNQLNLFR